MKNNLTRLLKLLIGLILISLSIVMTINANLGVSPWDVFHQGLSNLTGITMGRATIFVGFFIVVLDVLLGQTIGWATIFNMIFVGIFIDFIMLNNIVPTFQGFFPSVLMLFLGLLIEGYGVVIYLSAELGAGPRDGLLVALTKKTGKSVRFIKSIIEIGVVFVGYLLGGYAGIGTIIMAFCGGQIFQFAFKTVKFDVKSVHHRFIQDDLKLVKERINIHKAKNPL